VSGGAAGSGPEFDAQLDSLVSATRVLVALSIRTLGSVRPVLTPVQLRVLAVLSGSDGVTMSELAAELGVHPSNATRVCDRLGTLGLVRRREKEEDRRMLAAGLTPAGADLLVEIMTVRRRALGEVLAALPEWRRSRLADDLDALLAAAGTALRNGDRSALGWIETRTN
jgi:DNA-binding MarR family transcriptional regulator